MKVFEVEFSELKNDFFLRMDFDYFSIRNENIFSNARKLREYLTFIETGKPIAPEDYEDFSNNIHIVVRNIADGKFNEDNLVYINDDKADELKNYRLQKGDTVIAISSNCGYSFYFNKNDSRNITLSHYLARFRIDETKLNPIYLNYYINSSPVKKYFRSVETGKTLKNLSKYYIGEMPVIVPTMDVQEKLISQIEPIEQKINKLKQNIEIEKDIINEVFQEYFNFDYEKFETLKRIKIFEVEQSDFSSEEDLRFSEKFHRPAAKFIFEELEKITNKKIKHFAAIPLELGASVSPDDYEEDTENFYVSMATIGTWHFLKEKAENVSDKYFEAKENKSVQKNDIIMVRSGEGAIGKVAIIEDEIKGIFADFTIRIRLKNISQKFSYYYFRTDYFQYLIETYKKGLGNNTNIFPSVLQEFPIPDIPLTEQKKIVQRIDSKINEQKAKQNEIQNLRCEIDRLIEKCIFAD